MQRASLLSCIKEDKIWSNMTTKDTLWLHSLTVFNRQIRVWSVAYNFGGGLRLLLFYVFNFDGGGSYEIIGFVMFSSDWRELGGEMMGYFLNKRS